MEDGLSEWKERAEELAKLWGQHEEELSKQRAKLVMKRRFDKTIADLIDELTVESAKMADKIESLGKDVIRQWPDAFHLAHTMKRKSALLKRAYRANVEKEEEPK